MNNKMKNDSKYLSYLLRHHPDEVGCDMDEFGWVDVNTLISNTKFTLEYLKEIVQEDTRYGFSDDGTKIRAFHGHSYREIVYEEDKNPPNELYHGTSLENYEKILNSGMIKCMNRAEVHLSSNEQKAKEVGSRHGKPIVLVIDCIAMKNDGFVFHKSEDDVYLTSNIDVKYIKKLIQ